jgi:hypothetical protein
MKYWYRIVLLLNIKIFKNRSYSVLKNNVEGLTFEDIQTTLIGYNVVVYNKTNEGFKAKFTCFHTNYILSFTPNNIVKRIELEYWKELNVEFGNDC